MTSCWAPRCTSGVRRVRLLSGAALPDLDLLGPLALPDQASLLDRASASSWLWGAINPRMTPAVSSISRPCGPARVAAASAVWRCSRRPAGRRPRSGRERRSGHGGGGAWSPSNGAVGGTNIRSTFVFHPLVLHLGLSGLLVRKRGDHPPIRIAHPYLEPGSVLGNNVSAHAPNMV